MPNLTRWIAAFAYLAQVLVVAQGGVLCFGAVAAGTMHDHGPAPHAGHCHSHGAAAHDHHHGRGHDTVDSAPAGLEPHHCPCAHVHVTIELGRVGSRMQLVHLKPLVASFPVLPSPPPPDLAAAGPVHRGSSGPPVMKQTGKIIRSTMLLI
jgi:hypothetical protein